MEKFLNLCYVALVVLSVVVTYCVLTIIKIHITLKIGNEEPF